MTARGSNREGNRFRFRGRPGRNPGTDGGQARREAGAIGARRAADGTYELLHPRCVGEREEDYAEGLEIWRAGEPEEAREVLRYALEGCGDNLWIHVALGRLALECDRDAILARGHFGYAVDLVQKALPPGFRGPLPATNPANAPAYDALDGLATSLDALGEAGRATEVRRLAAAWNGANEPDRGGS